MMSRLPYQWPIILSVVLHASILGASIVVADLFFSTESPKRMAAASTINVTMTASKAVIKKTETVLEEKLIPEPVKEEKPEHVVENKPKKVTTKNTSPALVKNAEPDQIKEQVVLQKIEENPEEHPQAVLKEKPPEVQAAEALVAKEQEPEQEFSKEALVIQDQVIGQQRQQQTESDEAQYQDQILSLIESNKYYPKRAKKMRQEGDVNVAFTLNRDGSIQNLKVLDANAPSLLKRAALKAIQLSALFPPFPSDFARNTRTFETKLSYTLL